MPEFQKIGRSIIIGKGLNAAHWTGQIIVSRDTFFLFPNASFNSVLFGIDGARSYAGAVTKDSAPILPEHCLKKIEETDLPLSPNWPSRKKKGPAILLTRADIVSISYSWGRLKIDSPHQYFSLGLYFWKKRRILRELNFMGWEIG